MNRVTAKWLTVLTMSAAAQLVCADIIESIPLPEPGKICFPQTELHAEWPVGAAKLRMDQVMLTHYLLVPEHDRFKSGHVFVGFRLQSQPEKLWLFNGYNWELKEAAIGLNFNSYNNWLRSLEGYAGSSVSLQPIIPIRVSNYPIDVSTFVGDGELLVGYGLSSTEHDSGGREAFDEMIQSDRFRRIWRVGALQFDQVPGIRTGALLEVICLEASMMHIITPTAQTTQ